MWLTRQVGWSILQTGQTLSFLRRLLRMMPQEIRKRLNLSQAAFAGLMGVSLRTVQDWEQGRRRPSGPAKSLLRIAEQRPDVFMELA